ISEGDNQAAQFEAFKKQLIDNESWVFLVSDPVQLVPTHHVQTKDGWIDVSGGKPLPPGAPLGRGDFPDYVDPDPGQTQQMIDGEPQLIRAVGDSIWSIAHFAAMLNNAAQAYALADEELTPVQRSTDSQSPPVT